MKKLTDKLYGGIDFKWWKVIVFAVATAILTAVFLIVPVFENTSFKRMGVTLEAWIFFAIIIMANCKKPLESALKTFVFFLVSQPLIYLIQVPFSSMGWQLFGYYRYWFILTILTFPAAFIGWFITKKNWLSLLILSPMLFILTYEYISCFKHTFRHFPLLLVTAVFCLGQVILYLCAFTSNIWQKILGFILPLLAFMVVAFINPPLQLNGTNFLPDNPTLSEDAVLTMDYTGDDAPDINVSIYTTGPDSMVLISATDYGTADFTITDGDAEYHYTVNIYDDEAGHVQIKITVK